MEMKFEGEELTLVMEALKACHDPEDPLAEKILYRYYKGRVETLEEEAGNKKRIGFI